MIGAKFNEMKVMTMHYMIMGCFFVYVNKDIGIYPCCFAPTSVVLKGRGSVCVCVFDFCVRFMTDSFYDAKMLI